MLSKLNEARARRARGDQGFTLIELLVVVVIIGILIAIAIPVYLNYQKGSHDKATASDMRNAVIALEECYSDYGSYPTGPETWDASSGSTVNLTGCGSTTEKGGEGTTTTGGQAINLSDGTEITYTPPAEKSSTYKLAGKNSDGHSDGYFCYNSADGGSVKQQKTNCSWVPTTP